MLRSQHDSPAWVARATLTFLLLPPPLSPWEKQQGMRVDGVGMLQEHDTSPCQLPARRKGEAERCPPPQPHAGRESEAGGEGEQAVAGDRGAFGRVEMAHKEKRPPKGLTLQTARFRQALRS